MAAHIPVLLSAFLPAVRHDIAVPESRWLCGADSSAYSHGDDTTQDRCVDAGRRFRGIHNQTRDS